MSDFSKTHELIYKRQVNLSTLGDNPIYVPFQRFQVMGFYVSNATANLGASTSTLGLYTAVSAGGNALVTGATGVVTPLTTAVKVTTATIAGTDLQSLTYSTAAGGYQLFINVGGTANVAALVDCLLEIRRWAGP